MSDIKSQALSAATRRAAIANLAPASTTVFVDVAEEPTRAEVSRGGVPLGEIAVKPELITSFLDALHVVQTKIVEQSIVAGTAVARGTAIDISLADTRTLPVAVVPGVHAAFTDLTMAQLNDQWASNAAVRDIIKRRTSADDLTAAERTTLTNELQAASVTIDDTNTVDAAFTGIKAAFTFLG
jgi:hypothetical protein